MKKCETYYGFGKEDQAEYEKELTEHFGDKVKGLISETKEKVKDWSQSTWDKSHEEFETICHSLTDLLKRDFKADSQEVQNVIRNHYQWLKKFWTPTKETYAGHAKFLMVSGLKKAYEVYDTDLPKFIAEAIEFFAKRELH